MRACLTRCLKTSSSYLIARKINVEKFKFKERWRGGNRIRGKEKKNERVQKRVKWKGQKAKETGNKKEKGKEREIRRPRE